MLVRSTADDDLVVAVKTNNRNHPVILCRPGKGSWAPAPRTMSYIRIVDVLFHGNGLYGITGAEDLVALDLADDVDGRSTVANVQRLMEHPPGHQYDCPWWSNVDGGEELDADDRLSWATMRRSWTVRERAMTTTVTILVATQKEHQTKTTPNCPLARVNSTQRATTATARYALQQVRPSGLRWGWRQWRGPRLFMLQGHRVRREVPGIGEESAVAAVADVCFPAGAGGLTINLASSAVW